MIFVGVRDAKRRHSRSYGEALRHHRPILGQVAEMMIQWIIKGDDRVQRVGMPQKGIKILDNFWLDRVLIGKRINYYLQFLHWLCHLFVVVACREPALLHSCRLNLANPILKFLRKINEFSYSELSEHRHSYAIEIQRSINSKDSKQMAKPLFPIHERGFWR